MTNSENVSYDIHSALSKTNRMSEQDILNAQNEVETSKQYTLDLYNSDRATKAMNKINNYADKRELRNVAKGNIEFLQEQGMSKRDAKNKTKLAMQNYTPGGWMGRTSWINDVVTNNKDITYSHFKPFEGEAHVGLNTRIVNVDGNSVLHTPGGVTAHEISHTRRVFQEPNLIKKKHVKWLTPETDNEYLSQIRESAADLMDLRTSMYNAGIVDGTSDRYTNKHIKQYNNYVKDTYGEDVTHRYLALHPKTRYVRKALNKIYGLGGKINPDLA